MFVLVYWNLENSYSVLTLTSLVHPKKETDAYAIGEDVQAKFGSKTYPAKIVKLDETRSTLEEEMLKLIEKQCVPTEANDGINAHQSARNVGKKSQSNGESKNESPSKRKRVEQLPENDIDEQAKVAKAEENKKKRIRLQQRNKTVSALAKDILEIDDQPAPVAHSTPASNGRMMEAIQRLEHKVDMLHTAIESVVSCKGCLKKLYRHCVAGTAFLHGTEKAVRADVANTDITDSGLAFLGDAKFNIKLPQEELSRSEKASTTAEKLTLNIIEFLLNIIEFLLTKDEIDSVTVYGNKQHNKKAMDENKRKALRSHIFNSYFQNLDYRAKEEEWGKLTSKINDKIRKMRTGVYKSIHQTTL